MTSFRRALPRHQVPDSAGPSPRCARRAPVDNSLQALCPKTPTSKAAGRRAVTEDYAQTANQKAGLPRTRFFFEVHIISPFVFSGLCPRGSTRSLPLARPGLLRSDIAINHGGPVMNKKIGLFILRRDYALALLAPSRLLAKGVCDEPVNDRRGAR